MVLKMTRMQNTNRAQRLQCASIVFTFVVAVLLNYSTAIGQDVQHWQTYGTPHEYTQSTLEQSETVQPRTDAPEHTKFFCGVDQFSGSGHSPSWNDSTLIPWENYAYGEYIGPPRTPHVPAYRLRVDDQIEFVFQVTRENYGQGYRLSAGDSIRVTSPVDEKLNEATRLDGITIMPDNSIALDLVGSVVAGGKTVGELKAELDSLYSRFYDTKPNVVVSGIRTGTKLRDFLDSVDARAGAGGQSRQVTVNPDGTVRLPLAGTVGVVGLSLDELEREINMRYAQHLQGLRVTPILAQRAPRFIYVAGEVAQPGRFELSAPTSAMQAIALAGGWNNGGNIRQIVVFRRDKNWQLMAIKLDLAGGLFGKQPIPSDEIWLRDSDIVLIPKTPILRLADAIELYFSRTLYGIFPSELGVFDAQSIGGVNQ
jgi:polysaccharide export outer membrane protein